MQTFFSYSSILNYVHSLPMFVSERKAKFYFSISNDVVGVKKSNNLNILEIISYFGIFDIDIPSNSYMSACTNTQNNEEGENCASTISVEHTLGSYMNLFGSDMILFGSYLILFR